MIFLVVRKYVLNYRVMSNIIATKCADVTVVLVLAEEFLLSAAVVTIYSSKGISAFPHGPFTGVLPTGSIGVSFSGSPLNDFLTSHLTYSMLQSIPICTEYNQYGRNRYMIYGVGSRPSRYCIHRRMVRSRMPVALLPLMGLRLTPVLVLVKIMLASFETEPLPIH